MRRTIRDVLADEAFKTELIASGQKRFQASANFMRNYHDKWVRFNKIYSNIVDVVEDADEPNTGVVYAYKIVEDLVSKIAEPLLQLKPPCRVAPRSAHHEEQARRFSDMAAAYFRTGRYQEDYTMSTRECVLTGNAWEKDCWFSDYEVVQTWSKAQVEHINEDGSVGFHEEPQEVAQLMPRRVGYGCEFPSVFRVFPEPGVERVEDMHWICEEVPAIGLEDLKKVMTVDEQGNKVPFFDFSELESERGAVGSIQPIPMQRQSSSAEDELRRARGEQADKDKSVAYNDDVDRISIMWVSEKNRKWAIAQGRYVVAYVENFLHTPRITYRLKRYTPIKGYLFGTGAIEPVENQLSELNDIHKMSMRNWVRIINRMVAFNEDAIPYEDDFTPSALGRVRVRPRPGRSVAEEIVPIMHQDVTPTMLNQESNTKGIIEGALSIMDYAPGPMGTRPGHKTYGGMMEISRNMAVRITTVQRQFLCSFQLQMWAMEKLVSQFLVDRQPFAAYGPDGSTAIMEWDLWDIHTGGAGFDYIIEYDPSFGDEQIRRNQLMALLNLSFTFIQQKRMLSLGGAEPDVDDLYRRILMLSGWSDTSKILRLPDGVMNPDDELRSMLAGQPVKPNPQEDVIKHLAEHLAQRQALGPMMAKANQSINPEALLLLQSHIAATQQLALLMAQDPTPLVAQVLKRKMGTGGIAPVNTGAGVPQPPSAPAGAAAPGNEPLEMA